MTNTNEEPEGEGKKEEVRGEGGIYVRDKAARRDVPAPAPFGGTPTPFGARWAGSRNVLPFGRPLVYITGGRYKECHFWLDRTLLLTYFLPG